MASLHKFGQAILAFIIFFWSPDSHAQSGSSLAQSTMVAAGYDVVSIKPAKEHAGALSITPTDNTFRALNISLRMLVAYAYGLREDLVTGVPDFARSARFDIVAKISESDRQTIRKLTWEQRRSYLGAVLADRFHLRAHLETKTLPVFELVVVQKGPRFKESSPRVLDSSGGEYTKAMPGNLFVTAQAITGNAVPISALVTALANVASRNVIDKTELTGTYDFSLSWTVDELAGTADRGPRADAPPPLFTALQEQLGLKLIPSRGPVETVHVDHAEMPTAD